MPRDTVNLPLIGRAAEVRADAVNEAERTIEIVWTTGAMVQRRRYEGWDDVVEYDEELVVSADAMRLERMNAGAPFLDSHSGWSLSSVLGSVVPGSVRIEGGQAHATVRLTAAEDARDAVLRIMERSVRFVSVGYKVHKYEIVKEDGKRELWRAVDWEPYEVSAVAMPADPGAHVRSAEGARPGESMLNPCVLIRHDTSAAPAVNIMERNMTATTTAASTDAARTVIEPPVQTSPAQPGPDPVALERQRASDIGDLCATHRMPDLAPAMVRRGITLDAARAEILSAIAAQTSPAGARSEPVQRGTLDETETRRRGMEDALLAGLTGQAPTELARSYHGMPLIELAAERLGERRVPGAFGQREQMLSRAFHSTSDFPLLFENAMNRALAARYAMQAPTYRKVARQRTYADFRDHSTVRVGDFPTLQAINPEAGEIPGGSLREARERTRVLPYGVRVNLSRTMLVNDTLNGLQQVLNDRGMAVARFEDATFYAMMLSASGAGPTLLETTRAVFNTTDGTLAAANAAITIASVTLGRAALMKRKSLDGADLELPAAVLLCGPDKQTEAQQLLAPIQAQQAGNVNPFSGMMEVAVTAKITGNAWYMFASPDVAPCFEWGLLEGYEAPRFRIEEIFGTQGTGMTLEHDFGCGAIDWRGGYRNAGA
jgi:hypothetical protein